MSNITVGTSGASTSEIPAYDQLPYHAMRRLAERYTIGEKQHGRDNWRKGLKDKLYVLYRAGHVIAHALHFIAVLNGLVPDDGDDDAAAIAWGGCFLAEAQEAMKAEPLNCSACGGDGVHGAQVQVGDGTFIRKPCPACKGTGKQGVK